MKNNMNERIKDLQDDLEDAQQDTRSARKELEGAQKWYNERQLEEAQAIIRLHEAQKEI
jgi:hypothetical protein